MSRKELQNGLIVSCQPVPGGPMDTASFVVGFAQAAVGAGAKAVRIQSAAYVEAVRKAVSVPIIGLIKRDLPDSPVRITPYTADVKALSEAGADVIAFDATQRTRPASVAELLAAVRACGRRAMADCASADDGRHALAAGVDYLATTLSGYVGGPEPEAPDLALVGALRTLTPNVIAEGRIRTPAQAAEAIAAGAFAVVVGSAITRTEHATAWFLAAIEGARGPAREAAEPTLAIDIGGTKMQIGLVADGVPRHEAVIATDRDAGPDHWLSGLAERALAFGESYAQVGIAATGVIRDRCWSALNPATLAIPDRYPLIERAQAVFGKPVLAVNDAQAAAWGEFVRGAGGGGDMVFLTISTGIGGGIVLGGRLLGGLAGSFGLLESPSGGAAPLEDEVSGRWIAAEAERRGQRGGAEAVFAAAASGAGWAEAILAASSFRVTLLCRDIQLMLDPERIVIGGGIGLAPGYLDRVRAHLKRLGHAEPDLVPAKLGRSAGIVGVADLASRQFTRFQVFQG